MNFFYLLLGIIVNCIWGLAFLIPYYLSAIDPVLIVLSRYFFYGLISVILLFAKPAHWRSLTRLDWQKAMLFAFAGNLGYYLALTLSIHYAGIAFAALIVGALPITMMIYGNIKNKEFSYRNLLIPILLISIGIITLKWSQYSTATTHVQLSQMLIGTSWAIVALAIWTWYGVANATYLKKHLALSPSTWALAIGVCCLIQVIIIAPILLILNKETVTATLQNPNAFQQIIIGGFILGVIVSWLATSWWNKISRHLPTTLAAQLLVFETISSLSYGYILDRTAPTLFSIACIMIVLLGILAGIRVVTTKRISSQK